MKGAFYIKLYVIFFLFRLENKPPMPYHIWTEKLSAVVRQWYKALGDSGRDVTKVTSAAVNFTGFMVHLSTMTTFVISFLEDTSRICNIARSKK